MRWRASAAFLVLVLACAGVGAQPGSGPDFEPLSASSLGASSPPPPRTVTPPVSYALSIDGDFELGGFVFKDGNPFLHNDGGPSYENTAVGLDALVSTTPGVPDEFSGRGNTALGSGALANNTTGNWNTAVGGRALQNSSTGRYNTAIGALAFFYSSDTGSRNTATGALTLIYNSTGDRNTASGFSALYYNTTGDQNTANGAGTLAVNTEGSNNTGSGAYALQSNTTGSNNTAVGYKAGTYNVSGSNNIWIGSYGADESNTLRIGNSGSGYFEQNRAFISGIHNATLNGMNEHLVCVDDADQLGVCSESSARFKSQIAEMGALSASLLDLRPVVFRYEPEAKKGPRPMEYGLIAEEVAEVFPHLVRYDDEGRPLTLRYDLLTPLLLNELQRQNRQNQVQWLLMGGMFLAGLVVTVGRWRLE